LEFSDRDEGGVRICGVASEASTDLGRQRPDWRRVPVLFYLWQKAIDARTGPHQLRKQHPGDHLGRRCSDL